MPPLRLSIAGLMAVVAVAAVTFAAVRAETEFWADVMVTLALAASGVALLGRLVARGPARTAWTGYLVLGGGTLAAGVGPWCEEHLAPHLATTRLMDARYAAMQYAPARSDERVWVMMVRQGASPRYQEGLVFGRVTSRNLMFDVAWEHGTSTFASSSLRGISPAGYRRLGHSALSFWAGLLGVPLAFRLAGRSRRAPHDAPETAA